MKKISVIGFGKIGQAIAANILDHGHSVMAIDINGELASSFNEGRFTTKEPGIQEILLKAHREKKLSIGSDSSAVKNSDAIIVAIPLLIDRQKKILQEPFLETFQKIAPYLEKNLPVIVETSMPVGFGRNSVVKAIESMGKKHGNDFLLAHSPERIKSGTMMAQLKQIPKVIGGVTMQATEATHQIYSSFFDPSLLNVVESIEAAEMIKLAGMIYRDFNIALSNQLAQFADAVNVSFADLIPLINTDKEADLLYPGIGVGGHCTPVYPYFLIQNFKEAGLDFTLARDSRQINDAMPAYAVSLIKDRVKNKTALVLGLGFRPNVKEDAVSITYLLSEELANAGFTVSVHDVEFSADEIRSKGFNAGEIYSGNAEVVFLATMHKEYYGLDFEKLSGSGVRIFVDGRNSVDRNKVTAAGITYIGIGR